MALVGLKLVTLGLVDNKTQKLIADADAGLSASGIVAIDSKMLGTKTANVTGLSGSTTKVPGNNVVQDVMVGPSAPAVAFNFNNLDILIKNKILGMVSDGKGGYTFGGSIPNTAVLIESQTLDRKNSVFFGFGRGIMSAPSQNIATDTDTAQTREDDNVTYTALTTDAFNGEPYKLYYTGDPKFDKANMMKEVFGGYVDPTATKR
ncbi:phage tail protein [Liquorilactobacillus uvarum]|uniref:phage tail protein n=1 Tax=Liquorilactobacillus uvarum TaxID=303240 RepID=UPI00288BDA9D|nr:phage tail protein [Liquorilactobacillus uvarum]